jgi:hypothetical protein
MSTASLARRTTVPRSAQARARSSSLATIVATVGLSALFDRFPDLSLAVPAEELQPLPTFIMNGHRGLPVCLTAVESAIAA